MQESATSGAGVLGEYGLKGRRNIFSQSPLRDMKPAALNDAQSFVKPTQHAEKKQIYNKQRLITPFLKTSFSITGSLKSNTPLTQSQCQSEEMTQLNQQLKKRNQQVTELESKFKENWKLSFDEIIQKVKSQQTNQKILKSVTKRYNKKQREEQMEMFFKQEQQQHASHIESLSELKPQTPQVSFQLIMEEIDYLDLLSKPTRREGSSMVSYKNRLFMYGGLSDDVKRELFYIDPQAEDHWNQMDPEALPKVKRCGHSCSIYKNQMVVFGGQTNYNARYKTRTIQHDMYSFNMDLLEWSVLRPVGEVIPGRRNHESFIFGNQIFFHGGIGPAENYGTKMAGYNFDTNRSQNYDIIGEDSSGIAFHKIVVVSRKINKPIKGDGESKQANVITKVETVYLFGGLNGKGQVLGGLKQLKFDLNTPVEWVRVQTLGEEPKKRYSHSLDYYAVQNQIILYGGKTEANYYNNNKYVLSDLWILNLFNMTWVQIKYQGPLRDSYSHCSSVLGSQLYIFGGIGEDSYNNRNLYKIELNQNEVKKIQYRQSIGMTSEEMMKKLRSDAMLNTEIPFINSMTNSKVRTVDNSPKNLLFSYLPLPTQNELRSLKSLPSALLNAVKSPKKKHESLSQVFDKLSAQTVVGFPKSHKRVHTINNHSFQNKPYSNDVIQRLETIN